MKTIISALFAAGIALSSSMSYADNEWTVTDSQLSMDFALDTVVDGKGVYGEAGRVLRLSPLKIDFDPIKGGRLMLGIDPSDGWGTYATKINYTLSYAIYDQQTDALLANEKHDLLWHGGGSGVAQDLNNFNINNAGGGFSVIGGGDIFSGITKRYTRSSPCESIKVVEGSFSYTGSDPCSGGFYGFDANEGFSPHSDYTSFVLKAHIAPVPEPETYVMLSLGLAAVIAARGSKARRA